MPVTLDLPDREALWTQADATAEAHRIRFDIVNRTRGGVGSDGEAFKRKKDGSPSNLIASGQMLSTLKAYGTPDGDAVVEATVDYAEHVEAAGRAFLDLTPAERDALVERVSAKIAKRAGAK